MRDEPTCAIGFWEPLHEGCPVCGPSGPCIDPEYEALIQKNVAGKNRRRRVRIALLMLAVVIAAAVGWARFCA